MKKQIIDYLSSKPLIQKFFHGHAQILMLHRIAPHSPNQIKENENMKVSPKHLENFILSALKRGYNFISLDTLYEMIVNQDFQNSKNIVFTIDDGYLDNYTYAFPIFKKYKIPFCIYLCTSYLSQQPNMWWYSLGDFILQHSSYYHPITKKKIDISTSHQKSLLFMELRRYILQNLKINNTLEIMDTLNIPHDLGRYSNLTLTTTQITEMLESTLLTLGNHTHTHPVINNLTPKELEENIKLVSKIISETFNTHPPKHFCLPFGGITEIDTQRCDMIKNFHFKTTTTTRCGTIYPQHKNFLNVLPRIFFSNQTSIQNFVRIRKQQIVTY